ncbi:hypothetical protein [Synoicihabitans lomoniglobus]|uniref:Uncharacterized protein n=1 Tax=Synoicihabitans lomoniglobus TaxID=2909285 RepID=A0AAF0CPC2_9BACT|nr:hypothetical protein [Opitutaceae bacterium LMO-M01]WED63979.1 hypothetical protein PXH66_16700 [Opitutaceae bacterium LMO-M01]
MTLAFPIQTPSLQTRAFARRRTRERRGLLWSWSIGFLLFGWVLINQPAHFLPRLAVSYQAIGAKLSHQQQLTLEVARALTQHSVPAQPTPDVAPNASEGTPVPAAPNGETTARKLHLYASDTLIAWHAEPSPDWSVHRSMHAKSPAPGEVPLPPPRV